MKDARTVLVVSPVCASRMQLFPTRLASVPHEDSCGYDARLGQFGRSGPIIVLSEGLSCRCL